MFGLTLLLSLVFVKYPLFSMTQQQIICKQFACLEKKQNYCLNEQLQNTHFNFKIYAHKNKNKNKNKTNWKKFEQTQQQQPNKFRSIFDSCLRQWSLSQFDI